MAPLRKAILIAFASVTLALPASAKQANLAGSAKDNSAGYYGSYYHPDFGQGIATDSHYQNGDGYYGALPDYVLHPEAKPWSSESASASTKTSPVTNVPVPVAKAEELKVTPVKAAGAPSPSFDLLMKQGESEFAQSAYHASQDSFSQAVSKEPNNQLAHMWLGLSQWHLYEYDDARDQMNLAFRLQPFNSEGTFAKKYMIELSAQAAKFQRPAVDPPDTVAQTLRIINRQASGLAAQKIQTAQLNANFTQNLAYFEAQRIRHRVNGLPEGGPFDPYTMNQLAAGGNPYAYLNGYGGGNWLGAGLGYAPGFRGDASDLGAIRANYVYMDGFRQATLYRANGTRAAANLQESANNLMSLLGDTPRPGEPRLRAFGTNLYVRYYGDEAVDSPPAYAPEDPPIKAIEGTYPQHKLAAAHKKAVQ